MFFWSRGMSMCVYQSQNRKGREILPSLSYHSTENNRQRHHFILKMEDYFYTVIDIIISNCLDLCGTFN